MPRPASPPPPSSTAASPICRLYVDQQLQGLPTAAELALFAPINSPQFTGVPTGPTANPGSSTGQLATTAFVTNAVAGSVAGVASFNTRVGVVVLIAADITAAGGALLVSPAFTGSPTAPTQAPGDNATHIATTAFVHAAVAAVSGGGVASFNTRTGAVSLTLADVTGTGVLANTALTGIPTAPTANPGTSTVQLATTAFVQAAVTVAVGVASFNGRTGVVTLQGSDVSAAGGALINSPTFTGNPQAPTPAPGDNDTSIATTAFVTNAIASGANVTSFNGRSGAVTLNASDISGAGGAILNSPAFTGTPTSPTPTVGDNSAKIATTAFVTTAIAGAGVASFNGRTGAVVLTLADVTAVGGAPIASPTFTGIPAAPTAAPGTTTTQLATTAFVTAAVTAGAVVSFNSRTGAVTLQASDVSAVGGALLASPTFTGVPAAPTAAPGTSTGQLATTAFVAAALAGGAGVVTFNTRAGAVVLLAADVTGVGGALLAGPAFTGVPTAPTAAPGTSTTQLATTAFAAAAAAAAGVTSFNSRTGPVTLSLADVTGVGGAPIASPTFTGTPAAPTATGGTNTTQIATTAFVQAAIAPLAAVASPTFTGDPKAPTAAPGDNDTSIATTAFVQAALNAQPQVTTFNTRGGAVVLLLADVTGVGGAPIASPVFTGDPQAPTPAAADNDTSIATTAFVKTAIGGSVSPIFAYFAGTIVLTLSGWTVSTNPGTGVFTSSAAHGITTGQVGITSATAPSALGQNQAFYLRALSTTTFACYPTLADAKADTNRFTSVGSATGWAVKLVTYTGTLAKNLDAIAPVGFWTAHNNIFLELNLSTALPQNIIVVPALGYINGMFDNGGTPAARSAWTATSFGPTIVNSTLLRWDQTTWVSFVGATTNLPGTWASQATNNFSLALSLIA